MRCSKSFDNGASGFGVWTSTTAGQKGRKGHKNGNDKSSTASAVKKLQNAQKKSGQRLSLDRKDNERGYESKNVINDGDWLIVTGKQIGRAHV